jgi:hypothetical protein
MLLRDVLLLIARNRGWKKCQFEKRIKMKFSESHFFTSSFLLLLFSSLYFVIFFCMSAAYLCNNS